MEIIWVCFVRFVHIEISLIYEPIINAYLPQLVSYILRELKERFVKCCGMKRKCNLLK